MIAQLLRRLFGRRPIQQPDRLTRTEECECGLVMPVGDAHLVSEAWDDPKQPGAGSAVSAAFCAAHCPGGCNHPKEHTP